MWRILKFSYEKAAAVILIFTALTIYFGAQIPDLQIKVSSDELIPKEKEISEITDDIQAQIASLKPRSHERDLSEQLNTIKEVIEGSDTLPDKDEIQALINTVPSTSTLKQDLQDIFHPILQPGPRRQYEQIQEAFGSDEVAVVYIEDEHLFDYERLKKLRDLNSDLKSLKYIQRVESLFTVNYIKGEEGWIDTTPLLDTIPKDPEELALKQERASENPILLRNVISQDGEATIISLYLDPQKRAEWDYKTLDPKTQETIRTTAADTFGIPSLDTKLSELLSRSEDNPERAAFLAQHPKLAELLADNTISDTDTAKQAAELLGLPSLDTDLANLIARPNKDKQRKKFLETNATLGNALGELQFLPNHPDFAKITYDAIESIFDGNYEEMMAKLRAATDVEITPEVEALIRGPMKRDKFMFMREHPEINAFLKQHKIFDGFRDQFQTLFQIGSPAVQVSMTEYILNDQETLLPLSGLVLVILIGLMLRSVQGAIIPVLNLVISAAWTLGAMALLDVPINMLNYIVPALMLVIGATEDVHILVDYKEAKHEGKEGVAAIELLGHRIGLTLGLTGLTTILGFAVTSLTDLKIMQDFGITAALGMFARFIVSIVFLPAYLRLLETGPMKFISLCCYYAILGPIWKRIFNKVFEFFGSKGDNISDRFAKFVMNRIVAKPWQAISVFLLLTIPCLYYATHIRMSNDLISFLDPETQLVKQLDTLSDNLSGTKVIYLTLEGAPNDFKQAKKIQTIEKIATYLRNTGEFDTVTSLADYLALVNREMHGGDAEKFRVPDNDQLVNQYLLFFHRSNLRPYVTGDYARANIVIRCNINDSTHLNHLMADIRNELDKGTFGPVLYKLTGKSVMVSESVDKLSSGQTMSLTSMATILFVIVAILFLSGKCAFLTVVSNLFAIILLFGVMGLFGIPLNVGTCMVAAITIGIGIDDTLHLMVRYNKELKVLKDEWPAIERAVKAEFFPVIITSLGLAGGFLVLATSSFIPVGQFGTLSAIVIVAAVAADLILTPVLLSQTRLITLWDVMGLKLRKQLMEISPMFKGMSAWQAKKLILASDIEEYEAGSHVIKTGDTGDAMYVVLDGELEVSAQQGKNKILLAYLSMGEVFGEIALISRIKRTADVVAKTDAKVLVYDWESLVRLRRLAPYLSSQLLLNLANILGKRLVDAQSKLDSQAQEAKAKKLGGGRSKL